MIKKISNQVKIIKEKSSEMHTNLVHTRDAGLENANNTLRAFFEKIINATVDNFKHICKDCSQKDYILDTSKTEEKWEEEIKPSDKETQEGAHESEEVEVPKTSEPNQKVEEEINTDEKET